MGSEPALAGVVAGSVLILAVAFLLARSKKSTRRNVSEDFEDDDLSLFSKSDDLKNLYPEGPFSDEDLDGVLLTPGSNRNRLGRGRRARVLNEDDYYLSSPKMHPKMKVLNAKDKMNWMCINVHQQPANYVSKEGILCLSHHSVITQDQEYTTTRIQLLFS